jgi:hypothetical protein
MKRWLFAAPLVALAVALVPAGAAPQDKGKKDPPPTFTDPDKAGIDYKTQGEYLTNDKKVGAQAIARGDGSFEIVFFPGGLPGEGWDGKTRIKCAAVFEKGDEDTAANIVSKDKGGWTGTFKRPFMPPVMDVKTPTGDEYHLTRIERKSKTLGLAPPKGAVVLFDDSKSLDAWEKSAKLSEDGFLLKNATTKQKFQDFTLHIEFRLPYMPKSKGQARANSGVHPQNRYEIQVLDSFGLDSKKDDCAAIYGETAPSLNMCYPPLTWQTYDVEYTAARFDQDGKVTAQPRITVLHNGVKVHDNVEIKGKANAAPGPLHVSEHGNPVVYRNVWIVPHESK